MSYPRELLLFNSLVQNGSWNELMATGEYAVQYSSFADVPACAPYCTVFGTLVDAEAYAQRQVAERPALRCTIYDHHGLVGAPLRDIRGSKFKGNGDLTPRFRRVGGAVLFFGGLGLTVFDWINDFRFSWPALIGVRMLIPGLILLVMEAVIVLHAKRERQRVVCERGI